MNPKIILISFFSVIAEDCLAQDVIQTIDETKKNLKQPLTVTGSIGANTVFYRVTGIPPRRDPFYWTLNANLTFLLFNKVSVPFTAVFTQQDKNFTNGLDKFSQPFNQFGISPRYKWITVHAGFRSLDFSEYTLSGTVFLGGGVEIKPEASLYNFTCFYGRFLKAVPQGGESGIVVSVPAYERWGGGAKVRIGTQDNSGEFVFLKIRDNINSIPFDTLLTITPQENEIISFATSHKITNWLRLSGETSFSMFTKNLYENAYQVQRFSYINQIYTPRPSSQFNKVINTGAEFTTGKFVSGLRYKRIDPDYRSLGSVFLANDVEEFSANSSVTVFNNRVNLGVAAGLQRNNLDKIQVMTSKRFIGSLNVGCNITPNLNLAVNYSNFSSNTYAIRDAFTDSIKFFQLTQNGSSLLNYSFGKKLKQILCHSLTYQESGGNKQPLTTFLNYTGTYQLVIESAGLSFNGSFLYNRNTAEGSGIQEGTGPNIGFQKSFYKNKMRITGNYGFQNTTSDSKPISKNIFSSAGFGYTIDKHQNLRIDGSFLERKAILPGVAGFTELRVNIGYTYTFGLKAHFK